MLHTDMLPRDTAVQLIDADGQPVADEHYALPDGDTLLAAYRGLVEGRRINDQAGALVRQGRLAVYPSSHGQEACQVAAAMVLGDTDWLFPTYRDSVAVIARGVEPADAMVLLKGDWHSGYDVRAHRVAPQATPLATQLLHAVGFAQAAKHRGEDTVVLALCGDGATSEGDFHEAMNFAAVFQVPVVFFVQNNGFAISVPALAADRGAVSRPQGGRLRDAGTAVSTGTTVAPPCSPCSARRWTAPAPAAAPSLVEAHTYRMQAHTNADDDTPVPGERDEVQAWIARDPLLRLRTHLTGTGALDADAEERFASGAEEIAAAMRTALNTDAELDPEDLFRFVTATRSPQLDEQWHLLRDEIERSRLADASAGITPNGGHR